MTSYVKVSGTWQDLTEWHAKVSSTWEEICEVHVKVSGTWQQVHSGCSATVSANTASISNSTDLGPCYANLQYNTNGFEYTNTTATANNFSASRGAWLDTGASSDVWVERTIISGSLYTDPGAGRLNLGTTRSFREADLSASIGNQTTNMDIDFWDAASGGNNLQTFNITLTASYYNACPFCCFTPDTLITMAGGEQIPIGKIRHGDEIVVFDPDTGIFGTEVVDEIIVRVARRMYRITFDNGTVLHCSDDHPLYVEGKGPASIVPQEAYKNQFPTKSLKVGDFVTCIKAQWWGEGYDVERIAKIEYAHYPDMVYTLGNSFFFANNKLVY